MSDNSSIDWLSMDGKPGATINPFGWGCFGPGGSAEAPRVCSYCFAARLAKRNLRKCPQCQAFVPHWHPEELDKPLHWKRPRRIFVESMGDPFGDWVRWYRLRRVCEMMAVQERHTFYLLTKQPENILRLLDEAHVPVLPNIWLGASVDTQARAEATLPHMMAVTHAGWHTFVSVEPMLTRIDPLSITWADWVIIGAMSGVGAEKYKPECDWVTDIIDACDRRGVPVFLKSSITALWYDLWRHQWPKGAE